MPAHETSTTAVYQWCIGCGRRRALPGAEVCARCPAPVYTPDPPVESPQRAMGGVAASDVGDCVCSRCGAPCGSCACPAGAKRTYRQSRGQRAADARRRERHREIRRDASQELREQQIAAGICITCCNPDAPLVDGSTRCRPCLDRMAGIQWRQCMTHAILRAETFICRHAGDEPGACRKCRECVRDYVRANEPILRERVRRLRSKRIAAAAAARDAWSRDHEAAAAD